MLFYFISIMFISYGTYLSFTTIDISIDENINYTELDLGFDSKIEYEDSIVNASLDMPAVNLISHMTNILNSAVNLKNYSSYEFKEKESLQSFISKINNQETNINDLLKAYPHLTNIAAGQSIEIFIDNEEKILYFKHLRNSKEEDVYYLVDNKYKLEKIVKASVKQTDLITVTITSNLNKSLESLNITALQRSQIINSFAWQTNLNTLKKGSKLDLIVTREYAAGKLVTSKIFEVKAARLKDKKTYYIFKADNNLYYNEKNNGNAQIFQRYPTPNGKKVRVSSAYGVRKDPVSGKIVRFHHGVDFGLPNGSDVVAPANATVEKVAYQANGAGNYIVLKHNNIYKTVYMHLSRSLVKVGQKVLKGERIGISGNSGRSTGAHLHYELHVNNKTVNPMTAALPSIATLSYSQSKTLNKNISDLMYIFNKSDSKAKK